MIKNILNLGDSAIYCDFGSEVNKEINHEVIKYFKPLTSKNIKGIIIGFFFYLINKKFKVFISKIFGYIFI